LDCTVFTIAHRLATIIADDKVVVMDQGKVVEFGEPFNLIANDVSDNGITKPEGHLASMILETGDESSRALFVSAKRAYLKRRESQKEEVSDVSEGDIVIELNQDDKKKE